ncbi:hypothetical protein [Reinekea blandensis]|uniref:hypothetical protein n=1 Tax=Reinekea blandensis TaxID=374838 RepID=UPI00032102A4|nr:hypothetical protein [Reinekea blandensis]
MSFLLDSYKLKFDRNYKLIESIELIDERGTLHIFKGISVSGELIIPEPYGCPFIVNDISDRQLGSQKYEVEFASSYSREGVFTANEYQVIELA